jgi:polyisoprenoid-binding protein YceI
MGGGPVRWVPLRYARVATPSEVPVIKTALLAAMLTLVAGSVLAEPVTYQIDPAHTYPSFEADHFGGLSTWRGKFAHSSGTIVLDTEKGTGTVEVIVDASSIDFAMPKLDEHTKSAEMLDVAKYPTATFKGTLVNFKNGVPTQVDGQFTLHGVTHPLTLTINQFRCMTNPMTKKEVCGADASGSFKRSDYGVSYGDKYGFNMQVKLAIQVEAIRAS